MKTVLHWFRRDLRLRDNTAFSEAARRAETVVPVFIIEDAFRTGPDVGAARVTFLLQSLEVLRQNLARRGYTLVVRSGRSEVEIPRLAKEVGAQAVFCNRRHEPYAAARDGRVEAALLAEGVGFEVFKDAVVWEEREVLTKAGQPYTVFTPYAKAWKIRRFPRPRPDIEPAAVRARTIASETNPVDSTPLGHPFHQSIFPAGEEAAQAALDGFVTRHLFDYGKNRDFPALAATSRLSPHLRCGTIGIRTVLAAVDKARAKATPEERASCDVFLNELIWREFYLQILTNFPHVMRGSFRREYDALEWTGQEEHFDAWKAGQTGFPIVDAAMRCLNATGWMHNRLRMITAMFLVKDLLIHWQRGERYFMHQLVDGDMAANNGGWQWCAGTGTDAAPYFRIFNPVSQGEKFDPDGAFVRQWIPELANVPDQFIHTPWKAPLWDRRAYPGPIVRHDEQREKFLALFSKVKKRRVPKE